MTVRPGVRLAVDVGAVRVGVARSDGAAALALPGGTLVAETALESVLALIDEHSVVEVYVGHPVALSGKRGAAAERANEFASDLAARCPVPVRLIDERLTTVSASRSLRDAGRDARAARAVIDQEAAVIILEHALASERAQGQAPGTLVGEVP